MGVECLRRGQICQVNRPRIVVVVVVVGVVVVVVVVAVITSKE